MNIRLGPRLAACAQYCRPDAYIADIGTDHALLPLYLLQTGRAACAVASDVNPEPLARAAENIRRCREDGDKRCENISLALCNGLDMISPYFVQDIFIAGMGGELIADIIGRADWLADDQYRLILQPMSKPERLRSWLYGHGFGILDETAVIDNMRCYSVMHCAYTGKNTDADIIGLFCGRVPEKRDDAAKIYLEIIKKRLEDMRKGTALSGDSSVPDDPRPDKRFTEAGLSAAIERIGEMLNEYT